MTSSYTFIFSIFSLIFLLLSATEVFCFPCENKSLFRFLNVASVVSGSGAVLSLLYTHVGDDLNTQKIRYIEMAVRHTREEPMGVEAV